MEANNPITHHKDFTISLAQHLSQLYSITTIKLCQIITTNQRRHITRDCTHRR